MRWRRALPQAALEVITEQPQTEEQQEQSPEHRDDRQKQVESKEIQRQLSITKTAATEIEHYVCKYTIIADLLFSSPSLEAFRPFRRNASSGCDVGGTKRGFHEKPQCLSATCANEQSDL